MVKRIILICVLVFLATGCSAKNLNNMSLNDSIDYVLNKNTDLYNVNNVGYRYYLPRNYKVINNLDYNEIIYTKNYNYYFYIDLIKYINNSDSNFVKKDNYYLSKKLNYHDKEGYINIKQIKDKFYIEMVYNYAKIEVVVNKKDMEEAVVNASYILSSIRYNKSVVENKVGDEVLNFKEKKYQLKRPSDATNDKNMLDYIKEYDNYKETDSELKDTDIIGE